MATVDDLLRYPFVKRTDAEKIAIISAGKPRPVLKATVFPTTTVKSEEEECVFNAEVYDQEPWLTGCDKRQALFCWPCLLFMEERGRNQWNTTGISNFSNFQNDVILHKKTKLHTQGLLSYQLFHYKKFPQNGKSIAVHENENSVLKNREMVKRVIDSVLIVVPQLCLLSKVPNNAKQLNLKDCTDILHFLKNYETHDISRRTIDLLEKSPKILSDVVSAIASVLKEGIKEEAQQSRYVSIILNEHSEITSKYQISTVFRYLKDGKVCERFAGFTNVCLYKSAQTIYEFITRIVQENNISEQFVAYSVDGAVLASSYHLNPLRQKLREDYPFSFFTPCHFHDLDMVLEQSLLHFKECKKFFRNINSIKSFFESNSKACSSLNEFLSVNIDGLDKTEWSNSQFLRFLKTHREQFIKYFESVVNTHEYWEAEVIPKALAFRDILKELDTVFQLDLFFKIFECTSLWRILCGMFGFMFENAIGSNLPLEMKSSLDNERKEVSFEIFWRKVVAEISEDEPPLKESIKAASDPETKLLHREFYLKIIDCVIQEMDYRLSCLEDLKFFNILNCERYGKFVFDDVSLESLLSVQGPYFEKDRLENEIKVLCSNSTLFAQKSLYELMEFFSSANLKSTFSNIYQLGELILTLPCKPPSAVSCPSKLDKINAWSFVSDNKNCSYDLRFLCIEEEVLDELKYEPDFYDDVIFKFQELNNTLKLLE